MRKVVLLLIASFILSCHKPVANEISKIEFAKGTCMGGCIPVAISIDSSLHYKFYADSSFSWNKIRPKRLIVNDTGIVREQLWADLIKELDSIDYKHPDTSKKLLAMDAQHRELIIYWGKSKTNIFIGDFETKKLATLLDNSPKQVKLYPTNKTLIFGTTLQSGYRNHKQNH